MAGGYGNVSTATKQARERLQAREKILHLGGRRVDFLHDQLLGG